MLSREWPLAALQAVLMSGIVHLFVRAYSTKMHGEALRFQAQYLRRIRLPQWAGIPASQQQTLLKAVEEKKLEAINEVVASIYQLTESDQLHLTQAK